MIDQNDISQIAEQLDTAEKTGTLTPAPTALHPDMTLDDAYRVQQAWVQRRIDQGEKIVGHKIGLTSRAMQLAVGIDEPDYGVLTDAMIIENGCAIPANRFIQPRFEVELGFRLKSRLQGDDITIFDVLNATDWIIPAIEIIDCRAPLVDPDTGKAYTVVDSIADNAANGGVIWGGNAVRPTDIDLRTVPGILYKNGKIEETGVAAGVLGHPANGLVWLTRRLAEKGAALEAGEFVLSGSFTRPVFGKPGDTIHCEFGALGQVTCSISANED